MRSFLLPVFFIGSAASAFAQEAMLRVSLTNNAPITIALDDRYFHKHGPSLTIGHLPPGRHHLKVYSYTQERRGGEAHLLYKGKVQISDNMATIFVLDPTSGNANITQQNIDAAMTADNMAPTTAPAPTGTYEPHPVSPDANIIGQPKLDKLKAKVSDKVTDTDKMKLLTKELKNESLSTDQVHNIMAWFNFENTRLDFAKWAYNQVIDKEHYASLKYDFTYRNSQDDFDNFLHSSK